MAANDQMKHNRAQETSKSVDPTTKTKPKPKTIDESIKIIEQKN